MTDLNALETLQRQIKIVKDRIRGIVQKKSSGLYLYGRQGTGKTHTVCSFLKKLGINYQYSNGHLTPIGFFDLLSDNRDRIIVLDDVASLFNQPIALQLLLAALGSPFDGSDIRWVNYKTAKGDVRVPFCGGIIALSNLALDGHHNQILRAIRDRIFTLNFEPSDEQIIALIRHIAAKGLHDIPAKNCQMVAHFLIQQCQIRGLRPSVRLFVDKAIHDFELFESQKVETHWKDLICSELEQQLIDLEHPTKDISRAEQIDVERRLVADIYYRYEKRAERIERWKILTGKSQAAFYRRLKELSDDGCINE